MSLLVNLVSSSDGNHIGVGLTLVVYLHYYVPFFVWNKYFYPHLFAYFFVTVIATCNTFQQYCNNISDNSNTCVVIHKLRESSYSRLEW